VNLFGIGPMELLIIIGIVVVMFGGPVLIFVLGYALGRKSSEQPAPSAVVSDGNGPDTDAQAVVPPEESPTDE